MNLKCLLILVLASLSLGCTHPPELEAIDAVLAALPAGSKDVGPVVCADVYKDGFYVHAEAVDALFWVKGEAVYTVSRPAHDLAPDLPPAPTEISEVELREVVKSHGGVALFGAYASGKSEAQVQELEARVLTNPSNLVARAGLVAYYYLPSLRSPEGLQSYTSHVLYLIEHFPDSPLAGMVEAHPSSGTHERAWEEGKALWLRHVEEQPENSQILMNAAEFFLIDGPEEAELMLRKGMKLQPQDPRWPDKLAQLYQLKLQSVPAEEYVGIARQALDCKQQAIALSKELDGHDHAQLAEYAYDAGELATARLHAEKVLKSGDDDGDLLHTAHTVLGRVSLREGDTERAKFHLLTSLKEKRGAVINSFGPEFSLAKELLAAGERDSVVSYLDQCLKLDLPDERVNFRKWQEEIDQGLPPSFEETYEE